jgi:hypothetical protein
MATAGTYGYLKNTPTHFPNGINNQLAYMTHGNDSEPNRVRNIYFSDDFTQSLDIAASTPLNYTVTLVAGGGTGASITSTTGRGGLVLITNDNGTSSTYDIASKSLFMNLGNNLTKNWSMSFNVALSDVINTNFFAGLCISSATPLSASDFIGFSKASGAATCSLLTSKASSSTTVGSMTLVAATAVTLGARYRANAQDKGGQNVIEMLVNDQIVASTTVITNLSTSNMGVNIFYGNTTAENSTLTLDWINVYSDR